MLPTSRTEDVRVEAAGQRRAAVDHRRSAVGPVGPGAARAETVSRRAGSRWQGTRPPAAGRRRTALFVAAGDGAAGLHERAGREGLFWEAESGLVLPGMAIGEDAEASGGRYVGQEPSPIGQPSGIVIWSLAIERPGRYWLWARVRSADAGTWRIFRSR